MSTTLIEPETNSSRIFDIDIWDPALKADPGPTFARLAKEPPFYVEVGGALQAVATRYQDAKTALLDHERFSNVKRPWPGMEKYYYWQGLPVVTDTDPPDHTKLRMLLAPAFSPRRLAQVEQGVRDYVDARLADISRGDGAFDLMTDLARPLSVHVLLELLLDIPPEDRGLFIAVSEGLSLFASLPPGKTAPDEYITAWNACRDYCQGLIDRRRREPREDLVSNIIAAHDTHGKLTTDELFATFVILYVAGLSTTAHLIGWMLLRLCRAPDQLALLQRDPGLLNGAMEETLRIEPIGYTALRYATGDFDFEGLELRRNMPVIVVEGVSSFDAERYEDPFRFDITREPRRDFLAFGHGVHHCIGASVARMMTRNAVGRLVEALPGLRLQDPEFRPQVVGGPKDRGPATLPLAFG